MPEPRYPPAMHSSSSCEAAASEAEMLATGFEQAAVAVSTAASAKSLRLRGMCGNSVGKVGRPASGCGAGPTEKPGAARRGSLAPCPEKRSSAQVSRGARLR